MSEITFYGIVAILSFFVGMGAYQLVIGIYAAIRIMGDKKWESVMNEQPQKKINIHDARKLMAIIRLLCTKRASMTSGMIIPVGDGTAIQTMHIATYAEEMQKMDEELLQAAYYGAIEAIERYIHEE